MYSKPIKDVLSDAVEASPLGLAEIATRSGMQHPNMLKMILQGITQVPLARIPALARGLGLEERAVMLATLQEYHPDIVNRLAKSLHLPGPDVELGLAVMIRSASLHGTPETEAAFRVSLEAFLGSTASGEDRTR